MRRCDVMGVKTKTGHADSPKRAALRSLRSILLDFSVLLVFLCPLKFADPAEHMFSFWGQKFENHHVVSKRHEALKESFQPAVAYLMCDARCPASAADDNCCVHGVCTEVVVFLTRDCCHHGMVLCPL